MSIFEDKKFDKDKALRVLRDHDVIKCVVVFSGGNDEGGVDAVSVTYSDGTEEQDPKWCERTFTGMRWDGDKREWLPSRTLTPEQTQANQCADEIEQAVYDRYYTFAGEFYVDGSVVYDVPEGKVYMTGTEQVNAYEDVEVDL